MALSDEITGPSDAQGKLIPIPFMYPEVLPAHIEEKLQQICTTPQSPVDQMVRGMECLYAGLKNTEEFPDQMANVLGNLAHQVYSYQWHSKTERALGIYGFCLRVLGEGSQAVEDDPVPESEYDAPPEEP